MKNKEYILKKLRDLRDELPHIKVCLRYKDKRSCDIQAWFDNAETYAHSHELLEEYFQKNNLEVTESINTYYEFDEIIDEIEKNL
jgi:hypothetical protein